MREFWKKPEQLEVNKPVVPTLPPISTEKYLDSQGRLLINKDGMELVKHFESLFLDAYVDPVGVVTIGWGTIIYPSGKKVKIGDKCTREQAEEWLMLDLWGDGAKYVRAFTEDSIERELNDNQFSALVSLTYNRGAGRYRDFIAPHLNKRDFMNTQTAIISLNWSIKNDRRAYLLGLDRRRWAELRLFQGRDWREFDTVSKFTAFKNRGYK